MLSCIASSLIKSLGIKTILNKQLHQHDIGSYWLTYLFNKPSPVTSRETRCLNFIKHFLINVTVYVKSCPKHTTVSIVDWSIELVDIHTRYSMDLYGGYTIYGMTSWMFACYYNTCTYNDKKCQLHKVLASYSYCSCILKIKTFNDLLEEVNNHAYSVTLYYSSYHLRVSTLIW